MAPRTKPEYHSPMREEHPSTDQWVGLMSSYFLEPLQQRVVDPFRTELDDKLIVVDCGLLAILGYGALHIPRCDDLLVDRSLRGTGVGFCSVDDLNPRSILGTNCKMRRAYVARFAAASVEVTALTAVVGI